MPKAVAPPVNLGKLLGAVSASSVTDDSVASVAVVLASQFGKRCLHVEIAPQKRFIFPKRITRHVVIACFRVRKNNMTLNLRRVLSHKK